MLRVVNHLADLVGQTPLYRSKSLSTESSDVFIKLEMFNPMKHIHDRTAKGVIEQAEKDGQLFSGMEIIDASIGNYAISLAFLAGVKGYPITIVLPDCVNDELINMLHTLRANVVFSDEALGFVGAYSLAEQLAEEHVDRYVMLRGRDAVGNLLAHQHGTGEEIWAQTDGNVDAFVSGYFSGGILAGVSNCLKAHKLSVKTIMVEPSNSAVFAGHRPKTHNFSDIGPGFKPELLDDTVIDDVIVVTEAETRAMQKRLAHNEALFIGYASAAQACAAHQYALKNPNQCIVTVAQTYGERFITTITDCC